MATCKDCTRWETDTANAKKGDWGICFATPPTAAWDRPVGIESVTSKDRPTCRHFNPTGPGQQELEPPNLQRLGLALWYLSQRLRRHPGDVARIVYEQDEGWRVTVDTRDCHGRRFDQPTSTYGAPLLAEALERVEQALDDDSALDKERLDNATD